VASRHRVAMAVVALQADARQAVTAAVGHRAEGMAAAGHRVEAVHRAEATEGDHKAAVVVAEEAVEAGRHRAAAAVSIGC
jgi:hypothetical protein